MTKKAIDKEGKREMRVGLHKLQQLYERFDGKRSVARSHIAQPIDRINCMLEQYIFLYLRMLYRCVDARHAIHITHTYIYFTMANANETKQKKMFDFKIDITMVFFFFIWFSFPCVCFQLCNLMQMCCVHGKIHSWKWVACNYKIDGVLVHKCCVLREIVTRKEWQRDRAVNEKWLVLHDQNHISVQRTALRTNQCEKTRAQTFFVVVVISRFKFRRREHTILHIYFQLLQKEKYICHNWKSIPCASIYSFSACVLCGAHKNSKILKLT